VQSQNINGYSVDSAIIKIYACLKPSSLPAATKVATTLSSISIEWSEPVSNGCPIRGFSILRDTGNNDDLTVTVDPEIVSNKPSLREYEITGLTAVGQTYRFKVRTYNHAGYSDSYNYLSVVLANEPDYPSSSPVSDALVTNESRIKVDFGPQIASENGGSAILSYELQIDNGIGGNFTSLIGGTEDSLETTYTVS
jgi:hypothetical protein